MMVTYELLLAPAVASPVAVHLATTLVVAGPHPVPDGVHVTLALAVPARAAVTVREMSNVAYRFAGTVTRLALVAVADSQIMSDGVGERLIIRTPPIRR
jgi:hypothetical protein